MEMVYGMGLNTIMILLIIAAVFVSFIIGYSASSAQLKIVTITGQVTFIYNNSPSYVLMSGSQVKYAGNLSNITNLSYGAICTLKFQGEWNNQFNNGTCTSR